MEIYELISDFLLKELTFTFDLVLGSTETKS